MKKHLFLMGPSGCGKSYMIRQALGESLACAGGFVTERVRDSMGGLVGYDLMPAAAAAGIPGFSAARFLDYSVSPPATDNEVFRVEAVRLLEEARMYPYAVIDEFGGFELIIPQFREALLELLNSELPCIGVLKGAPNAAELQKRLGLGERYSAYRNALEAALENDSDTVLLHLENRDDKKARNIVRAWCDEYAK